MIMKLLPDEVLENVSGGQDFVPGFLVTGLNSPNGTNTVDAPVSALHGANTAIGKILTNVGDIANLSSPFAPV